MHGIPHSPTAARAAVAGACLLSLLVITPLKEHQKRLAYDLAEEGSLAP